MIDLLFYSGILCIDAVDMIKRIDDNKSMNEQIKVESNWISEDKG